MAQIQWKARKNEIQEMLNEKGADYVCEYFGVNRKHLLTSCRESGIYVESRQKRKQAKERELPNDLPLWLIKKRNEHLRRARL